jgi:GTPase SAR1 family protein
MGACACVDVIQKVATTSYIDDSTNINNFHKTESSKTIGMIEPPQNIVLYQSKEIEINFDNIKQKPMTNQTTLYSTQENTIPNQSIKRKEIYTYKDYENANKKEINITIFGKPQTGKSAFVIKFVNKFFEKLYIPTIGIEQYTKKIAFQRNECIFDFKVTPGNNGYLFDYEEVLNENDFIFLFYDVSSRGSFKECVDLLKNKISLYEKVYPGNIKNVIIIGSKVDIVPRVEPLSEIQAFCLENNYKFFEISSKNQNGFKELISYLMTTHNELLTTVQNE